MSRGHKILNTWFKNREIAQRAFNRPSQDAKPKEKQQMEPKKIKEAQVKLHQAGYNPPPQEHIKSSDSTSADETAQILVKGKNNIKVKEAVVHSYVGKNAAKASKEVPTPPIRAKKVTGYTGKNVEPPFEPDKNPKRIATAGKYGYGPSAARHLARKGMQQMLKINPKISESWDDKTLSELKKATLASYIPKAAQAAAQSVYTGKEAQAWAGHAVRAGDYAASDAQLATSKKEMGKSLRRLKGVETVTKKLAKEDTQIDELKASTLQSYADKAHQQAMDATYDAAHLNRAGEEKLKAQAKALAAKRAGGVQRAQTKLDKMKEEITDQQPTQLAHHMGDVVTCKKTGRLASVQSAEADKYTVVYADGSTETGPADYWTSTRSITEAKIAEQSRSWNVKHLKPAGHGIVGKKVRSYDFPGIHDAHYIEGHVAEEDPHSYHIRTTKVVRHNKEEPIPAHLLHVRAPKGLHPFGMTQGVYYAPREQVIKPKKNMKTLRGKR